MIRTENEPKMFTRDDTDDLKHTLNRFPVPMFAAERASPQDSFRLLCVNDAHQRATGMSDTNIKDTPLRHILSVQDAAQVEGRYSACVESDEIINYRECIVLAGRQTRWETTLQPIHMPGTRQRVIGTALSIELNAHPSDLDDTEFFAAKAQMQLTQLQAFLNSLETRSDLPLETRDHAMMVNGLARSMERVLLDIRLAAQRQHRRIFTPKVVENAAPVVSIAQHKQTPLAQTRR
jgi:hypothetical protein